MQETGASNWREVVEKHHRGLIDELSGLIDSDLRAAVSGAIAQALAEERSRTADQIERARTEARDSQIESLNRSLRGLRGAGEEEVPDLVVRGASAQCAKKVVFLVFDRDHAQIRASHGPGMTPASGVAQMSIKTQDAPAVLSAIESKDPVIALGTASEISPELAGVFGTDDGQSKAYLFPIVVRQSVMAMLVASGVQVSAPIELLCEAAAMRLEAIGAAAASIPEPSAAPSVPASETSGPRSWNDLSSEDQKLHLQAQRTARVRVAEMRLFHQNEIRTGTANSNLYGALQEQIDKARDQFLQTFLSRSPTMVDYLHLEILRSLAHDDDRLLGNSYPGPMV